VWSEVRGFNDQPSYGSTGVAMWENFDPELIQTELARGKRYFPRMNMLRWWHSWDAYVRAPDRYLANFEKTLQFAEAVGCSVMPVLFNRWHAVDTLDYGGVYTDHFHEQVFGDVFADYVDRLVGEFKDDCRISDRDSWQPSVHRS
jgi:hypothetical protein